MRMRLAIMCACVLALALAASARGQTTAADPKAPAKASLQGSVLKEPVGDPLKKAIIEVIAENQEEGGNYTLPRIRTVTSRSLTSSPVVTDSLWNAQDISR